jgi:hypothetical protein
MKKIFLSLVFLLTAMIPEAKAVNLGPFSVTDSFCQDFNQVGAILNSFQIVQWPVAGAPGVVVGLTQRTSVIHDLCDFITQLEQLEGINAVLFSANYLNELTGKKWDQSLKFADKTYNLANSVYDFDKGGVRKGALTSQSTARDLNDWMESAYSWHQKTFNNEDAYVQHRQEREADMQQFSRASYTKAILKEAQNCPTAPSNVDYQKMYTSKVQPLEIQRDQYKDDTQFYKQELYYMGPKFMNNDKELQNYIAGLQNIERDAVTYQMTQQSLNQTTYVNSGQVDSDDHQIMQKQNLPTTYFTYTTVLDSKIFNDFRNKWLSQWGTYVTAKWTSSGSFGALTGAGAQQVNNDFIDLNYECNPSRLGQGLDRDAPDHDKQLKLLVDDCKKNTSMNQKKAQNLFDYYVNQLQASLYNFKNANAQIWTIESQYGGINHLVNIQSTKDSSGSTFQQETVSCSDKMTPTEIALLQTKQQSVQSDLTESIAKESIKQSTMMENNEVEKQQMRDDNQRKAMMTEERNKQFEQMNQNPQAPFTTKGL